MVSTAARHHLELWTYINDVLRHLAGGEADHEGLLPDRWKKTHPESVHSYRDLKQAKQSRQKKERRQFRRAMDSMLGRSLRLSPGVNKGPPQPQAMIGTLAKT